MRHVQERVAAQHGQRALVSVEAQVRVLVHLQGRAVRQPERARVADAGLELEADVARGLAARAEARRDEQALLRRGRLGVGGRGQLRDLRGLGRRGCIDRLGRARLRREERHGRGRDADEATHHVAAHGLRRGLLDGLTGAAHGDGREARVGLVVGVQRGDAIDHSLRVGERSLARGAFGGVPGEAGLERGQGLAGLGGVGQQRGDASTRCHERSPRSPSTGAACVTGTSRVVRKPASASEMRLRAAACEMPSTSATSVASMPC